MSSELMPRLPLEEIGGAKVFRGCTINGKHRVRGDLLTAEELAGCNRTNLRALIDQRYIQPWRLDGGAISVADPGEVMIVPRAGATNRFDVIVGNRLNSGPLTKVEADALAKRVRPKEETATAA